MSLFATEMSRADREHARAESERKRADEAEAELVRWKNKAWKLADRLIKAESLAVHYAEALELACNEISESACFCPGDSNTVFACRLESCQSPKCWRKHLLYEAKNA